MPIKCHQIESKRSKIQKFQRTIGRIIPANVIGRLCFAAKYSTHNYLAPAMAGSIGSVIGVMAAESLLGMSENLIGADSAISASLDNGGLAREGARGFFFTGFLYSGKDFFQCMARKLTGFRPELNRGLGSQVQSNIDAIGTNTEDLNILRNDIKEVKETLRRRQNAAGGTQRPPRTVY